MKLTPEDFEAWREQPMTRLILDRMAVDEMELTRETHDAEAWEGPLPPAKHAAYRERHETLEWIRGLTFKDLNEWLEHNADNERT